MRQARFVQERFARLGAFGHGMVCQARRVMSRLVRSGRVTARQARFGKDRFVKARYGMLGQVEVRHGAVWQARFGVDSCV